MKGFKPRPTESAIERTPAAARVYAELRQRILHGHLAAGTLLNEVDTAAELGVSRTPVREALRELLSDGLIEDGPRRQALVTTASADLGREVQLMRIALETLAAREAATNHDVSSIDVLRLIMIRTRRALASGDINAALDCDDEFHLQIAQTAKLPIVADALRRLRGLTRLAKPSDDWSLDELERSAAEHEILIEALETGNPDAAEKAVIQHLATGDTAPVSNS